TRRSSVLLLSKRTGGAGLDAVFSENQRYGGRADARSGNPHSPPAKVGQSHPVLGIPFASDLPMACHRMGCFISIIRRRKSDFLIPARIRILHQRLSYIPGGQGSRFTGAAFGIARLATTPPQIRYVRSNKCRAWRFSSCEPLAARGKHSHGA